MARILGIDPGSRVTGFGIIEQLGNRLTYVTSGCIRTRQRALPQRLHEIFTGLGEVIEQHTPDEAAIEQVFVMRNADSALKLGQARGAALCALMRDGLPVYEYSATRIKQATVGRGHADKAQVQHMVTALLNLPAVPQADAADALACALCHAHTGRTLARMTTVLEAVR